ncbi:uncharacterized protein LOC134246920 [Saccostrea cucullata]|uniref:uncharacterized protein LOC134246920 n=1 Tax=Saccostrea cuccullata TaxID=36930 RepID=UPI002ED01023
MSCPTLPPSIPHGHISSFVSSTSAVYECDGAYSMVGSSVSTCDSTNNWIGPGKCELSFVDNVWFWLLIGLGALLTIAGITLLCVYCYRRCFRMRSRRTRPNEEENQKSNRTPRTPREDPGCFEHGGKCDLCCVDYYGCCSLLGCCGYHGCCACFCSCCRCCREPEEGPGISSLPVSFFRKWRRKAKGGKIKTTRPVLVLQYEKDKKRSVVKASKSAKVPVIPLWLPHKNHVRDINTSTR